MNILNYTPHEINILNQDKNPIFSIPSHGVARCAVSSKETGRIGDVILFETVFGDVTGLPELKEDTILVVSLLVRQALPARTDLYSPGEVVRNEVGQPIGCIGLTR
jgi:hypothetical protein